MGLGVKLPSSSETLVGPREDLRIRGTKFWHVDTWGPGFFKHGVPGPSCGAKFGGGFLGSEGIPQEQPDVK